jgi:hypothetical protein
MTAAPKLVSTTAYKIEKNVPFPAYVGGRGNRKFPFSEMEIGDSIVIPTKSKNAAYSWAKLHSRKFTIQPVDADTIRVWRKV